MKVSNNKVIIIFAITVACNVQAAVSPTAEEAQRALIDYKAELKFSPRIVDTAPTFYPAYSACLTNKSSCRGEFKSFMSSYNAHKNAWSAKLNKQIKDLEGLCPNSNEPKCGSLHNGAYTAVKAELRDLEGGSAAILVMQRLIDGGFVQEEVDAKMAAFKDSVIGDYTRLAPLLTGQSLSSAINNYNGYNGFMKNFKRLLMAVKLFRNPNDPNYGSQDGINVSEFIKPEIKTELAKINVPAGRFSVMQLDANLNIEALRKQNPNAEARDVAKVLVDNYNVFKSRYMATSVGPEVEIMIKAANFVIVLADQSNEDKQITFELYKDRLIVLERVVEGIIGSLNAGEPVDTETITEYVKMWLYAKQIVEENGMSNVLFEPIVMPAPIESPPPSVQVVGPAESLKSAGNTANAANASTEQSRLGRFTQWAKGKLRA